MARSLFLWVSTFTLCMALVLATPTLPYGIHSITVGQFQQNSSNRSQQVFAYYDINQDEHSDIITIVTTFSTEDKMIKSRFLVLYLWNEKEEFFIKQTEMNLSFLNVVSVICTQFYNRNQPQTDVVLTYRSVTTGEDSEVQAKTYAIQFIKVLCNQQNSECNFKSSFDQIQEVKVIDSILPSFIVLQGRMSLIFRKNNEAFALNFVQDQTGSFTHQVHSLLNSQKYLSVEKTNTQISSTLAYEISYFGDYNGDGIADLIISQKIPEGEVSYTRIHFFKYDKSTQKFSFDMSFNLKSTQQSLSTMLQFFSLQDINFDGRIDLVLLFKSGTMQIHYNKIPSSQTQLVSQSGHTSFPFDLYESTDAYVSKIQRVKLPSTYNPRMTSPLIFGDFNLDGFQQIIIDTQYESLSGQLNENGQPIKKTSQKSILLINQACISAADCGDSSFNQRFLKTLDMFSIRKFSIFNNLPTSYKANDSIKLSFIDLYKDGKLDLVSHKLSSTPAFHTWDNQQMKSRQMQIYYNNEYYDAFFMKVRVMRGSNYQEVHQNLILVGGNVNCFVTGLGGESLPKVGNQLAQVGRSLQLPYVFFGLGRTNNYVNELTITIPYVAETLSYQFMWTPIIPNSQIVTLANPEGVWQLSTFIQPTKKMVAVSLLVILSLIIIGVVICRLTAQQKSQDKQNLESFYTILR